jgi:hypothetical protein
VPLVACIEVSLGSLRSPVGHALPDKRDPEVMRNDDILDAYSDTAK